MQIASIAQHKVIDPRFGKRTPAEPMYTYSSVNIVSKDGQVLADAKRILDAWNSTHKLWVQYTVNRVFSWFLGLGERTKRETRTFKVEKVVEAAVPGTKVYGSVSKGQFSVDNVKVPTVNVYFQDEFGAQYSYRTAVNERQNELINRGPVLKTMPA